MRTINRNPGGNKKPKLHGVKQEQPQWKGKLKVIVNEREFDVEVFQAYLELLPENEISDEVKAKVEEYEKSVEVITRQLVDIQALGFPWSIGETLITPAINEDQSDEFKILFEIMKIEKSIDYEKETVTVVFYLLEV